MDPCQKRIPKWAEMAPQKARNDPNMLKIPKIFDFYHEIIRLKFLYRGSTKDLVRIVLSKLGNPLPQFSEPNKGPDVHVALCINTQLNSFI